MRITIQEAMRAYIIFDPHCQEFDMNRKKDDQEKFAFNRYEAKHYYVKNFVNKLIKKIKTSL